MKSSYIEASKPNETDTPNRRFLKHGISASSSELLIKTKKLKLLNQTVRRQRKKIESMKQILLQLKKKNLLNVDEIEVLMDNFVKHKNMITNWAKKIWINKYLKSIAQKYAYLHYHFIFFLQKHMNIFEESLTQ